MRPAECGAGQVRHIQAKALITPQSVHGFVAANRGVKKSASRAPGADLVHAPGRVSTAIAAVGNLGAHPVEGVCVGLANQVQRDVPHVGVVADQHRPHNPAGEVADDLKYLVKAATRGC
jgi:UDP-N-acetyl-D-mannosaminuronic acid transferase (WecB/TagA/CpsF family)